MHFEGEDGEKGRLSCARRTHDGQKISTTDLSTQIFEHNLVSFFMSQTDLSPLEREVILNRDVALFAHYIALGLMLY